VPSSRDLIKNVNDQTLEQVRRSQDAVVDAVRALSARAPRLPGSIDVPIDLPIDLPIDADRLIDTAFGFAQSALDLNHRFAHKLLALTGVETAAQVAPSTPETAAPATGPVEKVTVKRSAVTKVRAAKVAAAQADTEEAPVEVPVEKAPAKKTPAKKAPVKKAPAKKTSATEA
jgi:septal ring-binding cell division protein DamX